jgi:deoxyribonuclease-4
MFPMTQLQTRRIGAHLSTAGGIDLAVQHAHDIGANCLQVFSGSPRMWRRTPLDKIDAPKIWAKQTECGVTPIFTHALYLVNLVSDKPELVQISAASLQHDLKFDSHIKGSGVVVHVGSHQGRGFEIGQAELVVQIKNILAATPEDSRFLIENSAGQNGKIASDLQEICWLLDQVDSPRLGWCFDTCHGFAAGYNLGEVGQLLRDFNLWSTLKVIHVNDSRDPFDSGRDRHANIGEGLIPQADLKAFLLSPEVLEIPVITEAPGFDGNGPDAENINRIKNLFSS